MMELPAVPPHQMELGFKPQPPKAISVSELTDRIRGVLEPSFLEVWVQAEVSGYRPATSGHAYFSLKDGRSIVGAAVFGWGARKTRTFELKDGLQVLCRGKIAVYAPRGAYQFIIDRIEPVGAGALQLAFEQLKAKLHAEGLFDPARKRALPPFPKKIAVVTSPTGAVIRDMVQILGRRAPWIQVVVVPALVQGDQAPAQIVSGIEAANRLRLGEVIVVARGGGSLEDLWCFNDERVARAISQSALPVVSAVGHEVDFTITDFVSDLRAPTPSAAAEILSTQWVNTVSTLHESQGRMVQAMRRLIEFKRREITLLSGRMKSPRTRLLEQVQMCDEWRFRLERSMNWLLERKRGQLAQVAGRLDALSPLRVLDRGFAFVQTTEGRLVRKREQLGVDQKIQVRFQDGAVEARVLGNI